MEKSWLRTARVPVHAGVRWKQGRPYKTDPAQAKTAAGALLDGMGLSAHRHAVEPRKGKWAVIVECATGSGRHRIELRTGPEQLEAIHGDVQARAGLRAQGQAHPDDCKDDRRRASARSTP